MPRKSAYWKDPEKYREERKDYYYSHEEYVPRKVKKKENITFGYKQYTKTSKKMKSRNAATIPGLDETREILEKYYCKKYVPEKLRKMRKLNQVFLCQGYAFMTISNFNNAIKNRTSTTLSTSSKTGEQGLLNIIPYIERSFPSPKYIIFLNPVDQEGIDILILKDGTPYTVIELTNYAKTSYLHSREIERYIENLKEWDQFYPDIYKVLVVNHPENLKNNSQWKNAYEKFVSKRVGVKILR